jgi:hypothetical protein
MIFIITDVLNIFIDKVHMNHIHYRIYLKFMLCMNLKSTVLFKYTKTIVSNNYIKHI